jgi:hypothetical protein
VASGLWYLAVSHAQDTEQVNKVDSLIDWLDEKDIEVLTCGDGVQRIQNGHPDPLENQLPQASMLCDLDHNGKPDGFTGNCNWDTLTPQPVEGTRCLRVYSEAQFCCYGPELGKNAFSLWLKSVYDSVASAAIIYTKVDFDWRPLDYVRTDVQCSNEWVRIDTTGYPGLLIDVEDEVDWMKFAVRTAVSHPVMVVYPEFLLVPEAAAATRGDGSGRSPGLVVSPNPLRIGSPLHIRLPKPVDKLCMYDVLGRCLLTTRPPSGTLDVGIATEGLSPGIVFVRDPSEPTCRAKLVVLR